MPHEAYECTLSGILTGQFVQTVFAVDYNNTATQPPFFAAKDIGDQLSAAGEFIELFVNCLPSSYRVTSLRVRRVGPTGGPTAIALAGGMAETTGQRGPNISAAQVNPLIILIPTVASNKTGRIFMPGVDEDDIDDMVLVAGLVTAYQALITYMVAGTTIAGGAIAFGVLRRATKVVDPLDAGYISPLIGTQRRRLKPV
jgi:hypothetical protein